MYKYAYEDTSRDRVGHDQRAAVTVTLLLMILNSMQYESECEYT